jgi:flagellar biosynthesis protein FlhF
VKVKKYVGSTMQDTIFKVKTDLGPDAIILNTRKFKKGLFGLFGKTNVEIIAAIEEDKIKEEKETREEIKSLKNMIENMSAQWQSDNFARTLPEELRRLYQHLNNQGVEKALSRKIIEGLIDENYDRVNPLPFLEEKLGDFIGEPAPINCDSGTRVVTFIGPTGIGKTTTIAKLAANFTLDEGKKVGLITADTYRIAAIQQLKIYSDIINIPLHIAYNRDDLGKIIREDLKGYDLILIDTAGNSWNDKIQIGRMKELLSHDYIDEIHLIISMNMKSHIIDEVINSFSTLNPDKIILSKLDESDSYGDLLNIKEKYNYPYSYITTGQDVPDDIQIADRASLIKYILGGLYE